MSRPVPWTLYALKSGVLIFAVGLYLLVPAVRQFISSAVAALYAHHFGEFKAIILSYGFWAPVATIGFMVVQSLIPFLPGAVLTIANAWIFGWLWGACYSWVGALLGAMLDFGLARWYGRTFVEKIVNDRYLKVMNRFFAAYGPLAIALARLTPVIPYKFVSYGAGVTRLSFGRYVVATAVGQTPALLLYSYLGQHITRSMRLTVFITSLFVVLGVVLFCYRKSLEQYFFRKIE